MLKDHDYYSKLDLAALARSVPDDKDARQHSEAFQDLLVALAVRIEKERFTGVMLKKLLGEPDKVEKAAGGETWSYDWIGEHCSNEYRSFTPFVLRKGKVVGIRQAAAPAANGRTTQHSPRRPKAQRARTSPR